MSFTGGDRVAGCRGIAVGLVVIVVLAVLIWLAWGVA